MLFVEKVYVPKSGKRSTFGHKWAKNGVFVGGLRGLRFKKSTFGGVQHLPRFDPGYRPEEI